MTGETDVKFTCKTCTRKLKGNRESIVCEDDTCPVKYDMHTQLLTFKEYKNQLSKVEIISDIKSAAPKPIPLATQEEWEQWAQLNWPGEPNDCCVVDITKKPGPDL